MLRKDHPWENLTLEIDDNYVEKEKKVKVNLNIQTKNDLSSEYDIDTDYKKKNNKCKLPTCIIL